MREEVLALLQEIREDIDFEEETSLIDDGILESFDMITIIASLEDEFGIEVSNKYVNAENFNSLDAIVEMVEKIKNA